MTIEVKATRLRRLLARSFWADDLQQPQDAEAEASCCLVGYLDLFHRGHFEGWAADRGRLSEPVEIQLWAGDELVTETRADCARPDVAAAGFGPAHGFAFDIGDGAEPRAASLLLTMKTPVPILRT